MPVRQALRLLVTTGVAESEDELVRLQEEVDERTVHHEGFADD
jgi:hypothetical protein